MEFKITPPVIEDSHDNLHEALMEWDATGADSVLIDGVTEPLIGERRLIGQVLGITAHSFKAVTTVDKAASLTVTPHHHEPDPEPDPHPDDPDKQAEHLALLKLVPREQANHTVVNSGFWTNPNTWSNGILPEIGSKVLVPVGKNLTIDRDIFTRLRWLRVDGILTFLWDIDTSIYVDTIVGDSTSHLEINTVNPFIKTRIIITDDGPIDLVNDPFMLGRGFIWHGSANINGAPKATWTAHNSVSPNSNIITVDDATGWQFGDKLVFGKNDVQWFNYSYNTVNQDEVRYISGINGNIITLNSPLIYAHNAITANIPEPIIQRPVVINLGRNVIIKSESDVLLRRGHVMFMHKPNVSVKYAGFNNLGRTDKSIPVTDPDGLGGGLQNPKGRYSLHFHRTGFVTEVLAQGNAIDNSPGWGFVNHDSNVNAKYNVGYDVFGGMFVTETGNEKGQFHGNCAVRCNGRLSTGTTNQDKKDSAISGDGFWFEGALVSVTNNVSIACRNSGFTYFNVTNRYLTFKNNVSLFNDASLTLWGVDINGIGGEPFDPLHLVENNFLHGTVVQGYSSRITYKDNIVIALHNEKSIHGFGHTGVNTHINFINNKIVEFQIGIVAPTEGNNSISGGYFDNYDANILVLNTQQNNQRHLIIENPVFGNKAKWNVEMAVEFFSYDLRSAYPYDPYTYLQPVPDWHVLFVMPNIALGSASQVFLNGKPLYFEEQGADFKFGERLTRFPPEIRFEPNTTIFATTASLAVRNQIVGGKLLPIGNEFHLPKVRGILVEV